MANPDGGTGFPGQIQARDSVTKDPIDLYADDTVGALKVALYCYDPDDLAWERMLQPEVDSDKSGDGRVLMEYASSVVQYRGVNSLQSAATSATTWVVRKFVYSGNDLVDIQKLTGAWDNRASLAWV